MPIIQRPDLVSKIRKTYELLGPDAIATISPELVAVVIVDDISERDPGGTYLYAGGYAQRTPVAAQYSQVQLWNPPGSGRILRLEQVTVTEPTGTAAYTFQVTTAALAGAGTSYNRLQGALGQPVGQVQSATAAVPVGGIIHLFRYTGNDRLEQHPMNDVPEGQGFNVVHSTVNIELTVNFWWTELPAS